MVPSKDLFLSSKGRVNLKIGRSHDNDGVYVTSQNYTQVNIFLS